MGALKNVDPDRGRSALYFLDAIAIAKQQPRHGAYRAVICFRVSASASDNIRNVCHGRNM